MKHLRMIVAGILTVSALVWQDDSLQGQELQLRGAVLQHPTRLVGYTLFYDGNREERAMVLDLDTGTSFEIFSNLPVPKQTPGPAASHFIGWLPGHQRAIVEVGNWNHNPQARQWEDQYVVDFESNQYFSPTAVASPNKVNAGGLIPYYSNFVDSGYFFTVQDPATSASAVYKTHFDGTSVVALDRLNANNHGCVLSPALTYAVCEVPCRSSADDSCLQVMDIGTTKGPFKRAGIGVLWSPDGVGWLYFSKSEKDPRRKAVVLVVAPDHPTFRLACRDSSCNPWLGNAEETKYLNHDSDPKASEIPCDWTIKKSGTENGQWSVTPGGNAFYVSTVQDDHAPVFNQIGRVLVNIPRTPSTRYPFKFEHLTPVGTNARFPAPSPAGSSFVYVATKSKDVSGTTCVSSDNIPGDGPVQIVEYIANRTPRQVTHFPAGSVPLDPRWREMTNVRPPAIPKLGPGAGTFQPSKCSDCGRSN